ncbi:MAG: hypothetical protein KGL26_07695 [Pseudomonadota bacterium]|nr:hypothetical protein [Pseudomonadota bacterium]
MAMKKKKKGPPPPYAVETKDTRFAGTFEVLVPVEGRNRPLRVPHQFPTFKAAEDFIHSPDGEEAIDKLLADHAG